MIIWNVVNGSDDNTDGDYGEGAGDDNNVNDDEHNSGGR